MVGSKINSYFVWKMSSLFGTFADKLCEVIFERSLNQKSKMYTVHEVMESQSLVVFGASNDPLKSGSMLIKVLQDVGYTGEVAGINPKGGEVYGTKLYQTLDDVPFRPDLGVLHIQPRFIPEVVQNCARIGMKGVVISSEGFAESDEKGKQYQQEVQEILKSSGMKGFGPNTLGIINTSSNLTTSYFSNEEIRVSPAVTFLKTLI